MPARLCGTHYLRIDAVWNARNFFVNVHPESLPSVRPHASSDSRVAY
jgi:hypothetical protein